METDDMFFPIWRVSGRVFDTMSEAAVYALNLAYSTDASFEVETRDAMQDPWRHYVTITPASISDKLGVSSVR